MTTPPHRVHLEGIEICDFRGFPEEQGLQLNGQHLLLYGENGSGKTSIFQAISELLQLSSDATPYNNDLADVRCLKNRFTDETRTDGHVTLRFSPGNGAAPIDDLTWRINNPRPDGHALFTPMARTRGCLDYRAVLRTSFLHESKQGINLFSLLVTTLLRDIEMPTSAVSPPTFGVEWDEIVTQGTGYLEDLRKKPSEVDDAEIAKYAGDEEEEQSKDEIWKQYLDAQFDLLEDRIKQFNEAFSSRIGEIESTANKFIEKFDESGTIRIRLIYAESLNTPDLSTADSWTRSPNLLLTAIYAGVDISHPALVLNEARLTAIALAIYLAALKVETPESAGATVAFPRLLILDDVLIGLDMANRLPVLKLIQREFVASGWQVFLMTFDRAWYELAKQRLDGGKWKFVELYSVRVEDYEKPIVIKDQDHLERAKNFLMAGEVKAAAAHVRTEFELILKKACEDFHIPVRYDSIPSRISAADFWSALKSATFQFQPFPHYVQKGKDKFVVEQSERQLATYLQKDLITRIEHSVSWVLNRLVHSDFANRYLEEVRASISDVDTLRRHLADVRSGDFKELCRQRELLMRLVTYRLMVEKDKANIKKQRKKLLNARQKQGD